MRAVRIGLMAVLLLAGAAPVWAQTTGTTATTTPATIPSGSSGTTSTTVHEDCQLPGGGIGACPSTTIATNPLAGAVCPLLQNVYASLAAFQGFLRPLLQAFGCPVP